MQAVYTCLIVFTCRCAGDRIKFTLFGFHRFYVAQCSALQLLSPSAHIPCTLSVGLVCRIFHNIYNSDIHFCSLCFVLFGFVLMQAIYLILSILVGSVLPNTSQSYWGSFFAPVLVPFVKCVPCHATFPFLSEAYRIP